MIFVIKVILTSLIVIVALSLLYVGLLHTAHHWLLRLDNKLVGIVAGFTALLIICIMCMAAVFFGGVPHWFDK